MDVQLLAAILSATISATAAVTIGTMSWFNGRANLEEVRITEARRSLAKKLNEFYGPVIAYLNLMKALRDILGEGKPPNFRTLTYLINPEQEYEVDGQKNKVILTESDKAIIKEILEIEKKIEGLILEKGGLVEDSRLMLDYYKQVDLATPSLEEPEEPTSLAAMLAHFRVFRLAHDKEIFGAEDRYDKFVFPRGTANILNKKYIELHEELKKLNAIGNNK